MLLTTVNDSADILVTEVVVLIEVFLSESFADLGGISLTKCVNHSC